MAEYSDILSSVDSSLESFDQAALKAQKRIMEKIQLFAKDLEVDSAGNIKTTIANLRKINSIKAEISKIVCDDKYKDAVTKFCEEFGKVYNRQKQFYQDHFQEATISETAAKKQKLLAQMAVDNTIEGLTGAGINAQITDKISEMLQRSVTSGARWTDMVSEMRAYLDPDGDGTGAFAKYAKTYATTAMGQFTGQNNKLMTAAIDTEWFMYVGSEIETTREFCQHLTKKKYIHASEIPTIISGDIDGHQCAIYAKTGLPQGMIEGTTPENFQVNVGGWNCRHQLLPVAEEAVPADIRAKFTQKQNEDRRSDFERWWENNSEFYEMHRSYIERMSLVYPNPYKDNFGFKNMSYDELDEKAAKAKKAFDDQMRTAQDWNDKLDKLYAEAVKVKSDRAKNEIDNLRKDFKYSTATFKSFFSLAINNGFEKRYNAIKQIIEDAKHMATMASMHAGSANTDQSVTSLKKSLNVIIDAIKKWNIEERPVEKLEKELTNEEIVERLGGGDMTKGSCSSLAFAFAGNKAGFDVLDFRDGTSRQFFSNSGNIMKIAREAGGFVAKHTSDIQKAKMCFATIEEGKLYYFTCGAHAAIVRKNNGTLEYLELQSRNDNGWHPFTSTTLKYRFGAKQSHSTWGMKYETEECIIDIDLLRNSDEFMQMLGYINTAPDKQRKGSAGTIK